MEGELGGPDLDVVSLGQDGVVHFLAVDERAVSAFTVASMPLAVFAND